MGSANCKSEREDPFGQRFALFAIGCAHTTLQTSTPALVSKKNFKKFQLENARLDLFNAAEKRTRMVLGPTLVGASGKNALDRLGIWVFSRHV
jgi:hypothetical protein